VKVSELPSCSDMPLSPILSGTSPALRTRLCMLFASLSGFALSMYHPISTSRRMSPPLPPTFLRTAYFHRSFLTYNTGIKKIKEKKNRTRKPGNEKDEKNINHEQDEAAQKKKEQIGNCESDTKECDKLESTQPRLCVNRYKKIGF
jgi:hypothetical protein